MRMMNPDSCINRGKREKGYFEKSIRRCTQAVKGEAEFPRVFNSMEEGKAGDTQATAETPLTFPANSNK